MPLGQKDEFVGPQLDGHARGHFFHAQVEGLARGREAKRRQQHQRAHVQCALDAGHVHLAHQARVLKIHPIHNAHGARREEVARDHAHRGARHRRVGQALAERCLDLITQLPGGLLRAIECHGVSDADAMGVLGRMPLGCQLLIHLRAKAVHQHDLHAHGLDQCQVLRNAVQLAGRNRLTRQPDHKRLVAELVDVGRHRAEPGDEGEIEDGGHGERCLGQWW